MSPFLGTRGAGSSKAFDPGAGRPNQVTGLTATNVGSGRAYNDGRIDLSWSAPANNGATITGYKIERSTDGSTYSTLIANTGTTATTYSNTGLSSAQIYYYKISAINAVGTGLASTAANATSTTVPQAPTVTVADVGTARAYNNGAATVTITGGATGGSAISSYTATSSPGSFTATSGSPLTVTGLASATAYTFSVTATNANGSSTATVSGSITATTVPQAPTIGTASGGTSGVVSVPFTAGANGGKSVSTFTATSSSGRTATGASSPITVTEITAGTYTYTVTATNANGTSTASASSNSVTSTFAFLLATSNAEFNNTQGLWKSTNQGTSWSLLTYLSAGQSSGYGVEGFKSMATNGTGIIVGGGRYSPTPNQQWLYSSTNSGTTWTAYNPANTSTGDAFPYSTTKPAYGNNIFIVGGGRATNFPARSYYSSNGTSWSFANISGTNNRNTEMVIFNPFNNTFYASLEGATFHSSTNGSSWTSLTGSTYNLYDGATIGNSAASVWTSPSHNRLYYFNGSTWSTYDPNPSENLIQFIAAGNGVYVATYAETSVSETNLLTTSPDGTSWTMRANPFSTTKPQTVYFAGDRFYLSGTLNTLASSTTGTGSWTILPNWAFNSGSILRNLIQTS